MVEEETNLALVLVVQQQSGGLSVSHSHDGLQQALGQAALLAQMEKGIVCAERSLANPSL